MRRLLLLVLLLSVCYIRCFGQITGQTASFNFSADTSVVLHVNGELDASNTVGRQLNYQFGLYRYYGLGFEPLQSVALCNNGNSTVRNIALTFNNRGKWQTLASMDQEIFHATDSDKKKALELWKFVYDNHAYFYSPEIFNSPEIQDPVKFMTSYGYGNCFMIADAVKYLNTTYDKDSLWIWGLNGGVHAVTEYKTSSGYAVLDADQGGFYLHLDNQTLASYDDIRYDPYLYLRTQHFGPAYPYNSPLNYYNVQTSYLSNNNYRSRFWEYGNSGIDAAFSLKPGEQFSFIWPDTSLLPPFHQLVYPTYGQDPTMNDVGDVIKIGQVIFKPSFLSANTSDLLYQYNNIIIDQAYGDTIPVVHPSTSSGAQMMIQMGGPFVLTGGNIKGSFYAKTPGDLVTLMYSGDLVTWTPIWQSNQTGHFTDMISLDSVIAPLQNTATYGYYLQFSFQPAGSVTGCGIDSLTITDSCQVSRFFVPSLNVGDNSIAVQTGDSVQASRQLQLNVGWLENTSNTPPNAVSAPVFPANGGSVDSTAFTFSWNPATDNDGDQIVDYYFQLSDDSAMAYPLATNFNRYMSASGGPVTARFTPERPDFLNDGTTYYWRVRALDSRGAWSAWSATWTFTPHGPRTPVNFHYESVDSNHVVLRWSPASLGNAPVHYEIHVDTPRGFFPTTSDIIATPTDTSYNLTTKGMEYIRIDAVDALGNTSPPSRYITIWPPVTMVHGTAALSGLLPSVSNNGYTLKYQPQDTGFLQISGGNIIARKAGTAYVYAQFYNDIDSVIATEVVPVFIRRAPLQVGAADLRKIYGDSLPVLRYTFTGFVNGEDSSVLDQLPVLATAATAGSPVGVYPITVTGGSDSNYVFSYQPGTLSVDSALLTITAANDTADFGQPFPPLSYSISGWKNGDTLSSLKSLPVVTTDADKESPAGEYPITVSGGAATNYSLNYVDGALYINPRPPKLSFSVSGNYPDSSYNYKLVIDSSGGTFDNVEILLHDLGVAGSTSDIGLLFSPGDAQLLSATIRELPDNEVFTGVLEDIVPGHDYLVKAVVSNTVGSDTSKTFNIFTDVNAPFVIYPNPASSTLNLSVGITSMGSNRTILIYNTLGQVVYENGNMNGATLAMDVSQLPYGEYIVAMIGKSHTYVKRVMIIH
jgi:hypothetical protein